MGVHIPMQLIGFCVPDEKSNKVLERVKDFTVIIRDPTYRLHSYIGDISAGSILKSIRKRERISQKQLAEKSGISQYRISRAEREHIIITEEMAEAFGKALGAETAIFLVKMHQD